MKLSSIVLAASLLFPTTAYAPEAQTILIRDDLGGLIMDYERHFFDFYFKKKKIILSGFCMSACTVFMKLPGVCALPDTYFGFHAIHDDKTIYPDSTRKWARETHLPAAIALEDKYDVYQYGWANDPVPDEWVSLEDGVWLDYWRTDIGTIQKVLLVRADKLVPTCPEND